MRTLLAMVFACTFGYVATLSLIHLGPKSTGIAMAAGAAVIVTVDVVRKVRGAPGRHRRVGVRR